MATVWKGAVSFGLVNIPVRVEPATRDTETVRFRQLDKVNLQPIKMKRVNSVTGAEVEYADLVKGYEYSKGRFVVIEPAELEQLEVPTGRALELRAFVDATEIDPRHYETPYFLVPEPTAERAYALLREAIRESGVVGVGRVTMRQRTHVVTVRVLGDALVMDVIRPAAELIDPATLHVPGAEAVRPEELAMAEQLISHLRAPFDTSEFSDAYTAAVRAMIDAKLEGQVLPTREAEEPAGTPVLDLMARLRESLDRSEARSGASDRGRRSRSGSSSRGGTKAPKKAEAATPAADTPRAPVRRSTARTRRTA